ncbi:MAG: sigma-54 dependent transcriptional regulator [Candidatus Sumerlaeaceae bacterium]|nr:sigma-54 dependent transcriptional regulator [Candidatus Sumerlaeaceae bacterium]
MLRILIIDDEPKMSAALGRMLEREGHFVRSTTTPQDGLDWLAEDGFDVVLCDMRMPTMSGLDVLREAKRRAPVLDFVIMTAYADARSAVECMKEGALDYLIKPFSMDELKILLKRIEETRHLREENARLRELVEERTPLENIIAASRQMQDVLARARKVAAANSSVLLLGESGTGKEVIARAIHRMSPRAQKPLVVVNCGAIPETLLESELFGHTRGSFTGATESRKGMFETADGGTIFLDEIGDLPLHLQVKLLRVLQEGEIQRIGENTPRKVDVRVIAATNRDLEQLVQEGRFRQDLYYRLNVIPIYIPPLRERREDIAPLIEHFIRKYSPAGQRKLISPEALARLMRYDYPGNVRELENAIEHAVVLSDSETITVEDLPLQIQNAEWERMIFPTPDSDAMSLEELEKRALLAALEKTNYNITRAAAHLGITRRTLGYRIKKYGLETLVAERSHRQPRQNEKK